MRCVVSCVVVQGGFVSLLSSLLAKQSVWVANDDDACSVVCLSVNSSTLPSTACCRRPHPVVVRSLLLY